DRRAPSFAGDGARTRPAARHRAGPGRGLRSGRAGDGSKTRRTAAGARRRERGARAAAADRERGRDRRGALASGERRDIARVQGRNTGMTTSRPKVRKTVLAYSGGLDTSIIVHWLRDHYGCEVV